MDIRKTLFILICLISLIVGFEWVNFHTSPNKMISQDKDSISVMTYSLVDRDSTIKRYHKDIVWSGYIVSKENGWDTLQDIKDIGITDVTYFLIIIKKELRLMVMMSISSTMSEQE